MGKIINGLLPLLIELQLNSKNLCLGHGATWCDAKLEESQT
jgi:hypothetical protein